MRRDVAVPWSSIRERFGEIVADHGVRPAVVCGNETITYRDLHARATGTARSLVSDDDRRPVALDTESSLDCVVAIVSVLLSGRPLVLLDSQLPEERRAAIVRGADALRLSPKTFPTPTSTGTLPPVAHSDCAVLLFTSGSTGQPKSVIQGQRLWLNQAVDFHRTLGIGPGDRIGMALPLSFGGGMDVVVHALLNGATLDVLDPRERGIDAVPAWIAGHRPTTLHATPSLLRRIVAACTEPAPELRLVTTCGEAIHGRDVRSMRTVLGDHIGFCNLSGSSETGNLAFHELPAGAAVPDRVLPAGHPATNKTVLLLDADGEPVPAGVIGEIVLESRYLAEGYRSGDAGRFTDLGNGVRRYRTGDLARRDDDGTLHLIGRADDAVKIRGYLVEVAEIETAVLRHPGVAECAVLADKRDHREHLAVFYAPAPHSPAPAASEVRTHLARLLPSWMMPTHLVVTTALPRTERGKIDRSRLVIPDVPRDLAPARTSVEGVVAAQWAQALGLDTVGRHEDPFALGADSLALQRVLAALADRYGSRISVGRALADPTPAGIATQIGASRRRGALPATALLRGGLPPTALLRGGLPPTALLRGGLPPTAVLLDRGEQPLWCFCGAGGNTSSFVSLAREVAGDYTTYALQQQGLENRALPDFAVAAMVRRHLVTIRAQQPHGPYRLVGHSLGGLLALETARVLVGSGERVQSLTILDTLLPGAIVAARTPMTADDLRERLVATDEHRAVPPLATRLRTHWQVYTAGLLQRDPLLQEKVFWELGLRVGNRHHARPWRGDATVYLTADNSDDPAWWSALVTGNLETVRVPGDHLSVLRAPVVTDVAARIRARENVTTNPRTF
ncbi:Acyl-CoA synthetase (AMP-forming)/AMP-acid ligase II [Rhodococcus triatomae]|uniref:Acyl-CoA synthetase (AMP-forming)/AMP-acid ligase II n=1 Tax=Rhodococcus triatomae TaxID=300028 RepID=A0A1G7ZLZ5_9NOCA|nr:Acyl-CoA synthetase (AMP-forming)/AMP-acid ligase II [Rhodococcus triatomae]